MRELEIVLEKIKELKKNNNKKFLWFGFSLILISLISLPFIVEMSAGRAWIRIIDYALIYAILALGLNIVVGFAGLFSF